MDFLRAEIVRKRKLIEDKDLIDDSKKYFKRADLARKEEDEYFERCGYKVISQRFYFFKFNFV
ncbi:unnamed protein product [Oncorhynchus mykiss]|uniref:Uncharacterized protein n=1 Tax=Oncorhynchus mykiss TaxID=8022 RepID=A0A060Y7F4_ONCMY|nr:unnamed protein product [Oncorhynchus mykiss]